MATDTAVEITHYRHWWRSLGRSEATLDTYTGFVRRFLRDTGLEVAEVTREALETHLAVRRTKVKPSSLVTEIRAYRSFFAWWAEEEEAANPAARLRFPK